MATCRREMIGWPGDGEPGPHPMSCAPPNRRSQRPSVNVWGDVTMARSDAFITFATRRGWRKWVVAGFSLVLMFVLAGALGSKLPDVEKNSADSFLPSGAESTKALHLANDLFGTKDQAGLTVVFVRNTGLTQGDKEAIQAASQTVKPYVTDGQVAVVPSQDGRAALV